MKKIILTVLGLLLQFSIGLAASSDSSKTSTEALKKSLIEAIMCTTFKLIR